jgi:sodium/proline symporter
MTPHQAILATLLVYLAALVVIGFVSRRRTRDGADFYLAGRRMGPLVASLSASASSSSAWTLLGVSGFAYASGVSAVWLLPACVGGFALNWFVLAPRLRETSRRTGALTATEVLAGDARGTGRRAIVTMASAIILVSLATYVASQFQAAGLAFADTFQWPVRYSIVLGGVIVVAYTMLGGFWAASLTDTLQGLVMAATAVVLPVGALLAVGPTRLLERLGEVPVDGYISIWRGLGPATALGFVLGLLGIGLGYPGQPHVVNRFMALRPGAGTMQVARWAALGWAATVYCGMVLLGLCARVLFAELPTGESAFMTVANELFPPVLAGIIVAAVLSAVMSTADSQLLVAGSSVTHDLGLGGADRSTLLLRSRLTVLGLSAAAIAAALTVEESIFSRVLFAWSSMGCAFGPLLLVIALRGPVSVRGTLASMSSGFVLSVTAYALRQLGLLGEWSGTLERVVPFFVALLIAMAASQKRGREPFVQTSLR